MTITSHRSINPRQRVQVAPKLTECDGNFRRFPMSGPSQGDSAADHRDRAAPRDWPRHGSIAVEVPGYFLPPDLEVASLLSSPTGSGSAMADHGPAASARSPRDNAVAQVDN